MDDEVKDPLEAMDEEGVGETEGGDIDPTKLAEVGLHEEEDGVPVEVEEVEEDLAVRDPLEDDPFIPAVKKAKKVVSELDGEEESDENTEEDEEEEEFDEDEEW